MKDSKKNGPGFPDLGDAPLDWGVERDENAAELNPDESQMSAEEAADAILDLAEDEIPVVPEEDPIAELQAELAETREKVLRALADAENARRIAKRDIEDARKFGITKFARDVLEVADNFGRTLETIPEDHADPVVKTIGEGVTMTHRQLTGILERHGIIQVEPAPGDRFDHKYHQAMFEVPTAEFPPGHIAQVMKVGYRIDERLLRAAMVGVTRAPDVASEPDQDSGSGKA